MKIEKMILHVLDTESHVLALSDKMIEEMNEDIAPIVASKIRKVFRNINKKQATFDNSPIERIIQDYKLNKIDFIETSNEIAKILYEEKRKYNLFESSDFLFIQVMMDDVRYLVGIDNGNSTGLTHRVVSVENEVMNDMVLYKNLFSSNIIKKDHIFIIEYATSSVEIIETPIPRGIDNLYLFEEILSCKTKPSYNESVTVMKECLDKIVQDHHLDELQMNTRLKMAIKESVEEEKAVEVSAVAESVFYDKPHLSNEFEEDVRKQGIEEVVDAQKVRISKKDKTEKIKTDHGIEITIPVDYMSSNEFIEFITEEDGKISIRLKNIESIERK